MVKNKLSEGAFGIVYSAIDLNRSNYDRNHHVIIKFTQNHKTNDKEYFALIEIYEHAKQNG